MGLFNIFKKKATDYNNGETTPGGSRIYKHEEPEETSFRPGEVTTYMEEIDAHFTKLFPKRKSTVFHEILSDLIHIDVFVMEPTKKEPFYVLYTSGMSALPMTLPDDLAKEYKILERAEIMLFLPADWNMKDVMENKKVDDNDYWPIYMMKTLARFPHDYKTWLSHGHTIPNGDEYELYASNTKFSGIMLVGLSDNISLLKTKDGNAINFYMMTPLYKEETEYKLEKGAEKLIEKLVKIADNPWILDIKRENVCAK